MSAARPNGANVAVLHSPGVNRDGEAAWACELAGARPEIVHVAALRQRERRLADYGLVVLPGGFSYGDSLGAGNRLALDLKVHLADELAAYVEAGGLLLGICNGFQTLVKTGLLPGWPSTAGARRRVTLTHNESGRFECRWVTLTLDPACVAPLLAPLKAEPIRCPVAHGEGRFLAEPEALDRLEAEGLVAFRYADPLGGPAQGRRPHNPNGSVNDIAGITNAAGNVIGLMPHPEDHALARQAPGGPTGGLGLALFQALVGAL